MAKAKQTKKSDLTVTMDRRSGKERRDAADRRKAAAKVEVERRTSQRRQVARRRQIDPTTCERDYTQEEIEFMQAMDAYKRSSGRMFPTCSEILEVIKALGYNRQKPDPSTAQAQPDTQPAQISTVAELSTKDEME